MTAERPANRRPHRRTRPLPSGSTPPAPLSAEPARGAPAGNSNRAAGQPAAHRGPPTATERRELTIDARRRRVAELILAGYSEREIVAALTDANAQGRGLIYPGVSKSNIGRDILALHRQWMEGAAEAIATGKARHIARLTGAIEWWSRALILAASTDERIRITAAVLLPLMKQLADVQGLRAPARIEISEYIRKWARDNGFNEVRALEIAAEVAAAAWEAG